MASVAQNNFASPLQTRLSLHFQGFATITVGLLGNKTSTALLPVPLLPTSAHKNLFLICPGKACYHKFWVHSARAFEKKGLEDLWSTSILFPTSFTTEETTEQWAQDQFESAEAVEGDKKEQ